MTDSKRAFLSREANHHQCSCSQSQGIDCGESEIMGNPRVERTVSQTDLTESIDGKIRAVQGVVDRMVLGIDGRNGMTNSLVEGEGEGFRSIEGGLGEEGRFVHIPEKNEYPDLILQIELV